jgi:hypothetical protein
VPLLPRLEKWLNQMALTGRDMVLTPEALIDFSLCHSRHAFALLTAES